MKTLNALTLNVNMVGVILNDLDTQLRQPNPSKYMLGKLVQRASRHLDDAKDWIKVLEREQKEEVEPDEVDRIQEAIDICTNRAYGQKDNLFQVLADALEDIKTKLEK